MQIYDRADIESARAAFVYLLPKEDIRRACLAGLANSIEVAHDVKRSSWGTTLYADFVRLNVGMPEAFTITRERIYLVLDAENLNEKVWATDQVTRYYYEHAAKNGLYLSVPDSVGCTFPYLLFLETYPQVRVSHESIIRKAAKTRRNPSTRGAHSPGILKFLRNELQRNLPTPIY